MPVTPGIFTSTPCIHFCVERGVEWRFRAQALGSEFGLKPNFAAQEVCGLGQVPCTPSPSVFSSAEPVYFPGMFQGPKGMCMQNP